jgi:hypothetical protein
MAHKGRVPRYQVIQDDDTNLHIKRRATLPGGEATFITVNTYANGFGVWHAQFLTTGNTGWDVHVAKTAIGYELDQRSLAAGGWKARVKLKERDRPFPGMVTFCEPDVVDGMSFPY